ncbi:hypothetical protein SARC_13424 [Sphaeroforma arctica JP610]|uniref:Uncharacterized protein n=1 Tax=Sphaeroforma arctica JP610 TaxID=667725 RepID=A0A0L0FD71_9EUKA|nr:hypothetical protein SARC_13424 [Sphaeroforma arctica JP610]KNC74018.1 hypothetical protein SARC_13424 [Sphaeroforma arctica JP610]|eukprot:XP_014147920.1 hypothetical protein SARC_13424 [Sphaeroforma arctica JP610]
MSGLSEKTLEVRALRVALQKRSMFRKRMVRTENFPSDEQLLDWIEQVKELRYITVCYFYV